MQNQKLFKDQSPIISELIKLTYQRYPGPSVGWKWPSSDSDIAVKESPIIGKKSAEEIESEESIERRKDMARKR